MKKNASFQTIVLLILLCLAAPLSSAYAEIQGVATVVALRGTVVAQGKSGPGRNLSLKSQIFQEDVLKTDKVGQLQIMFTDKTIISLGRDSEMKIAEYRWQPEQKDGALKTQVKEGTFRVMGGALAKDAPQNFTTETPTATIGIRGSMYTFRSTKESLSVLFQGGKGLDIFNDLGRVSITVPGFGTHVMLNAPPARPTKFTEQELNNLNRGLNGKDGADNGGPPLAGTILPPPTVPLPPPLPPYTEPYIPPAPTPPTDGIFAFEGILTGISTNPSSGAVIESFTDSMLMGVNWHNHRILGVAYDDQGKEPAFFFGSVNGTVVSDLTILGADFSFDWLNSVGINSGNGTAVFAGAAYDLFAFAATGSTYLMPPLLTPSTYSSWTVSGIGQQVPGAMTPVAPTGTETWQGFVIGQSMEIADTSTNHAIYQSAPGGFTMTVNKDAGTISGVMNPGSPIPLLNATSFSAISNLQVGGSTANSVYLRDDLMAALITGGGGSPTLAPTGNFMGVAYPSEKISDYVTWGYWQIAYHDTTSNTDRIMPSMWIAGKPTALSDMPINLTGTYNGTAIGTEFNLGVGGGQMPIIGTCALTANFGSTTGTVSGNIYFTGVTLPISTGSISSNQFTADISSGGASPTITGAVKGGFFGPAASAVGGNFSAKDTLNSKAYLGIFGGNRGALFVP